jgi:hypothetical protein
MVDLYLLEVSSSRVCKICCMGVCKIYCSMFVKDLVQCRFDIFWNCVVVGVVSGGSNESRMCGPVLVVSWLLFCVKVCRGCGILCCGVLNCGCIYAVGYCLL